MGVSDITGTSDLCHPPPPYASNRDGPRLQRVPARLWKGDPSGSRQARRFAEPL